MISSYEIIPKKGFGELKFGMDMEKVVSALGEPEDVDNFEGDEELNAVLLHYQDKGFSVFFEGVTRQVVAGIETDYSDATLFGEKVIGMTEDQAIALMTRNGIPDYDKALLKRLWLISICVMAKWHLSTGMSSLMRKAT